MPLGIWKRLTKRRTIRFFRFRKKDQNFIIKFLSIALLGIKSKDHDYTSNAFKRNRAGGFNQVAAHLLNQNARSEDELLCLYRSDDGLKCAAGCLMSDVEYGPDVEGKVWRDLIEMGIAPEDHDELIGRLQAIHDHSAVSEWGRELAILASRYGLSFDHI